MLLGIIMGYYLSQFKFGTDINRSAIHYKKALLIPALLHGAFDFLLMANIPYYLFLLIPFVVYLWISGISKLRRYHRESREQHRIP